MRKLKGGRAACPSAEKVDEPPIRRAGRRRLHAAGLPLPRTGG